MKFIIAILLFIVLDADGQDTILLHHAPKAKAEDIDLFHEKNAAKHKRFKYVAWSTAKLPPGREKKALEEYKKSPLFDRIEERHVYSTAMTPNDAQWTNQWGPKIMHAEAAWNKASNTTCIVAVLDTGIDYTHPDLAPHLYTGPMGEHGYTCQNSLIENGGMDDHKHGTHVAGIIGARMNNGASIAGIAGAGVTLLSIKVLGSSGNGFTDDIITGVEKLIELKQEGKPIRIGSMSLGGLSYDTALRDVMSVAGGAGIIFICAAGNNNLNVDITPFLPACFTNDEIISVSASDQMDARPDWSNYGLTNTDLLAPGFQIISTRLGGGELVLSGTSMATPHVSGGAALLFGIKPTLTVAECKAILLDPQSLVITMFKENTTAGGRLDLEKLVNNPKLGVTVPEIRLEAPQDLRAANVGGLVRLTWSDRSVGESDWRVESRTKGMGPWTGFRQQAQLPANSTQFEFSPARKARYEFRVRPCLNNNCSTNSNIARYP